MVKSNCLVFLFLLLAACSPLNKEKEVGEQNIKTVEAYVDTILNNKQLDSLELFFSKKFIRKVNSIDSAINSAEMTANLSVFFTAFSDMYVTIDYIISVKDKVFMNWTLTGTNSGVFGDLPVTGEKIKISGITRFDLNQEGKIIFENIFYNELSLMQQLGYTLPITN